MIATLKKRLNRLEWAMQPQREFNRDDDLIEYYDVPYPHTDPVVPTVETTPLKRLAITLEPGETVVDAAAHLGIPRSEFERRVAAGLIEVVAPAPLPPPTPAPKPLQLFWEVQ